MYQTIYITTCAACDPWVQVLLSMFGHQVFYTFIVLNNLEWGLETDLIIVAISLCTISWSLIWGHLSDNFFILSNEKYTIKFMGI